METTKNSSSDSQQMPVLCPTGCGFFGNPTFENYCSQCYRQRERAGNLLPEKLDSPAQPQSLVAPANPKAIDEAVSRSLSSTTGSSVVAPATAPALANTNSAIEEPAAESTTAKPAAEEPEPTQEPRAVQKTKSKCYLCRAKIPLAMQITNQCRCEYVYCNAHKHPDQHDCDFEYKTEGRAVLAKNNPKLDDNKGGRSFNRLL